MSPWDEKHVLRGSPLYMAPEMVCQRQYDARVDLWSVGVILYGKTSVPCSLPQGPNCVLGQGLSGDSPGSRPCPKVSGPLPESRLGQAQPLQPPLYLPSTEALFGKPPFASRSFLELEEKIRSNRAIEVGELWPMGRASATSWGWRDQGTS